MSAIYYTLKREHHTKLVLEVFCSTCDKICSFLNYKPHDNVAFWTHNKEKILCPSCAMACDDLIYRRVFGRKDIPVHRSMLKLMDDSLNNDTDNKMIHRHLFCTAKEENLELEEEHRSAKCECGAIDCHFFYVPANKVYVKVTNERENHNGYQYQDGLNILDKPFEAQGSCAPGGLYFTTIENIHKFYNYGINIRIVKMPINHPDFKVVRDPSGDKWRANMILFEEKYSLLEPETYHKLGLTRYHQKIRDIFIMRDYLYLSNEERDKILSKWLNPKTYTELNLTYPKFIYNIVTQNWPYVYQKYINDIISKYGRDKFYKQWRDLLGLSDDDIKIQVNYAL